MKLKSGVVLALGAPMARALPLIESTYERLTGDEMWITSASDGLHMRNSRHYTGEAIDLRTRQLDSEQRKALRAAIASVLGFDFDVIDEVSHIHVEFDPKGGS